jgi:5-methylcytosine-specific restriction endonuclease McrA
MNRAFDLRPLCDLKETTYDVEYLLERCGSDNAYVFPKHQRKHRWNKDMNKLFIVSLLQNVPVPSIHLCQASHHTRSGKMWINDGGHRLRCIYQYCNNKWSIPVENDDGETQNVYFSQTPDQPGVRTSFTPATELRVLKAQTYCCKNCDAHLDDSVELDHIKPLWEGGSTAEDNCQALCKPCHHEKTTAEAAQRAARATGTRSDRVMTGEERMGLLRRTLPVTMYSGYRGNPSQIQRDIFDRVQLSATIGVSDFISSHTSDALVVHARDQFDKHDSAMSRMEAVVDEMNIGSDDWWSSDATNANAFAYIAALFTSLKDSTVSPDRYVPAKANKSSDAACHKEWASGATKPLLQMFDLVIEAVCDVLASHRIHKIMYADFAVLVHCCHRWGARWTDAAGSMEHGDLTEVLDRWESSSLTTDKILEKMGSFKDEVWTARPCYTNTRKRAPRA